jgi:hypothetical protein
MNCLTGRHICSLLALVAIGFLPMYSVAADEVSNRVASVEGRDIFLGDIRPAKETLALEFQLAFGRKPSNMEDTNALQVIEKKLSNRKLISKIQALVYQKNVKEFNLSANESEVAAKWHSLTNGIAGAEAANSFDAGQREIKARADAIQAVYISGRNPDEVYSNLLAGILTKAEWQIELNYHATAQHRASLDRMATNTLQDYQAPPKGLAEMVVHDKMNALVDKMLAQSDPNFARCLQAVASTNQDHASSSQAVSYLSQKRDAWWLQQYKSAKIVFYDPRYQKAWDDSINSLKPAGSATAY